MLFLKDVSVRVYVPVRVYVYCVHALPKEGIRSAGPSVRAADALAAEWFQPRGSARLQ